MMELLKRFEESDTEEADLGDEDEEEDSLVQKLKGVDLGTPPLEPLPHPTDVPVRFHVARRPVESVIGRTAS